MVLLTNTERVHNELIDLFSLGTFHTVTYDTGTKALTVNKTSLISPSQVVVHEVSLAFDRPLLNRQIWQDEISKWVWNVYLGFHQPASVQAFEHSLRDTITTLPYDATNGLAQVQLVFQKSEFRHPPQQQAAAGTHVKYVFDAEITPE